MYQVLYNLSGNSLQTQMICRYTFEKKELEYLLLIYFIQMVVIVIHTFILTK